MTSAAAPDAPTDRPRVLVLALGGTIASVPHAAGPGAVPTLTAADLVDAVPGLADVAQVEARTVRSVASASVTPEDLVGVARAARVAVAGGAAGVVVTQGTDTLEESAFLLDVLLDLDAPVVVTGAMRTPGRPGADGPANVLAAVTVAASEAARGLGVLAVFADEVHAARHVAKTHSSSTGAFASPGLGPLGRVIEDEVRLDLTPRHRTPTLDVAPGTPWPRLPILRIGLGTDAVEAAALAAVADGLVVEGVGGGHVAADLAPVLGDIAARIPVVLASRTRAGGTLSRTYGYPGSEVDLFGRGVRTAGVLDALKARLLLGAVLAADPAALDRHFPRPTPTAP